MEYGYEVLCALDLNFQRCDRQLEVTFVHCCLQLYVTCSNINAKQTGTFVSHRAVGRFQNLLGQIKQKAIKYGIQKQKIQQSAFSSFKSNKTITNRQEACN